jgi:hypothetical protein
MGAFSGFVVLFALCDALFIAAFLMIARLLFAGNASIASAATLWTIVCFPLIFVGIGFSCWDKKRAEKKGETYRASPGGQKGNLLFWAFISLTGDVLNIFAMSRGMPLTLGNVINRGVKALTVGIGSRFVLAERISRSQRLAVILGLIAASLTLLLAIATEGTLFDREAIGMWLGIPIWVIFCIGSSIAMGAKDIQARRVLDRLPVGTTLLWGSLINSVIGTIVVVLCYSVLGDWEIARGYPNGFWLYAPVAALCLVVSVPFRHLVKRMKGNLFLVNEFVAGVILLLMIPFDFFTKVGDWEHTPNMYLRIAVLSAVLALSFASSLILCRVSKRKEAIAMQSDA